MNYGDDGYFFAYDVSGLNVAIRAKANWRPQLWGVAIPSLPVIQSWSNSPRPAAAFSTSAEQPSPARERRSSVRLAARALALGARTGKLISTTSGDARCCGAGWGGDQCHRHRFHHRRTSRR